MIDRPARDAAATALRRFMEGAISNREFARLYPARSEDPAIRAIDVHIWFCYSDLTEYALSGKHALSDDSRVLFERCISFLETDLEYRWPRTEFKLRYGILRLLGFARYLERREAADMPMGDRRVWPFLTDDEHE